ncbi:MAG: alpha-galactosidase [Bacteroidales bacterium]
MKIIRSLCLGSILCAGPHLSAQIESPTMGWSSWNTYRINISDRLIMEQADAMKESGLGEAGYRYINIDDGYFGGRLADGTLKTHPVRFPQGLRKVVDHIHQQGFKAGIYSDAGRNTCGHFWDKDSCGQGVGLYGSDDRDAHYFFKDLNFDFIKIDFCGGDEKQNIEQLDLDEKTRYTEIRQAIDRVGRKDVRINVCRWGFPGTWVRNIGSSWRISPDITPNWGSVKEIIRRNLYMSAYAGEGHYNDMDMLEVGRGMGEVVDQTHFGMWCIMSSPLLIGCDMTTISESALRLLKNKDLISLNQDPLGLQANVVAVSGEVYLLVKDLKKLGGTERAFAIYNAGDQPKSFTIDIEKDILLKGKIKLRDAARQEDANNSIVNGRLTVEVPAHGSAFYIAQGEKRIEQTRYEAEDAWLEKYSAILLDNENAPIEMARVRSNVAGSGGKVVSWLGKKDNWLEWRRVYSAKGGKYKLTLDYVCDNNNQLDLSVNGKTITLQGLNEGTENTIRSKEIEIRLKKGMNTIRISNEHDFTPDIDKIEIRKID